MLGGPGRPRPAAGRCSRPPSTSCWAKRPCSPRSRKLWTARPIRTGKNRTPAKPGSSAACCRIAAIRLPHPRRWTPHRPWAREETIARYKEGRARTLKFIEEVDRPMKAHSAEHPFPVFNMLNAYQWLLYIPLHNARHNQQIAEALTEALKEEALKEAVR